MYLLLAEGASGVAPGVELACSISSGDLHIDHVSTSEEVMARVHSRDLLLLTPYLDDMSGFGMLKNLRSARIDIPVIYLSISKMPDDRAAMLRAGADDAVDMFVHPHELLARIFAVSHRARADFLPKTVKVGNIFLDLNRQAAFLEIGDKRVRVSFTPFEFDVLRVLAANKGTVVTREMLLDALYQGKKEPEIKILDVFISKMRSKMSSMLNWDPISTRWGRGYLLLEEPEPGQIVDKVA